MEIDLGGYLVGKHIALGIDDGHGRLVTRALDGKHELPACDLRRLGLVTLGRRQRPCAHGGSRGLGRRRVHGQHERQLRRHDQRVRARTIVVAANAGTGKAQRLIEAAGRLVIVFDLERCRGAAKHLGIVAHVRKQLAGNALATMRGVDGHVQDLNVVIHHHTAGNADDLAVIVRNPPGARGGKILRQLVEKKLGRPRLMARARKAGGVERCSPLGVRRTHGAILQMPAGELVGNARCLGMGAFAQAQPTSLVFLSVRQTRIDGQHARRVAVARGLTAQQALPRGPPQRAFQTASGLIFGKQLAIANKPIARQANLRPVGALAPFVKSNSGLDHALAVEHPLRARLINAIQRRIDLTAHRIGDHAHQSALARTPGGPSAGIESRCPQQRHIGATGQTLCRRDADAHAGKRTRPAPHNEAINVGDTKARLIERGFHGIDQLHVGMAATHMVVREHMPLARRGVGPAQGTDQHIGRSINRHGKGAFAIQRHLLQPCQSALPALLLELRTASK